MGEMALRAGDSPYPTFACELGGEMALRAGDSPFSKFLPANSV